MCRWPWVTLPKLVFTAHTLYLIYICWRLDPSEADLTHSLRILYVSFFPLPCQLRLSTSPPAHEPDFSVPC